MTPVNSCLDCKAKPGRRRGLCGTCYERRRREGRALPATKLDKRRAGGGQ